VVDTELYISEKLHVIAYVLVHIEPTTKEIELLETSKTMRKLLNNVANRLTDVADQRA
jgi:hypothetical protein